ncbi:MAG: hypothetical protein SOY07_07870 [Bacteroidales bacterium]|nr:hypothetical protein [Bacteroidales bacterium]
MKTLRLIGMALVAVMISAATTACDDDDDDDDTQNSQTSTSNNGIIVDGKKLVKTVRYQDDREEDADTYTFSYDSEGRVSNISDYSQGRLNRSKDFVWGNGTITETSVDEDGTSVSTYTLKNNRVVSEESEDFEATYTYNSDNRIAKASGTEYSKYGGVYSYSTNYSWDGDKISKGTVTHTDNNEATYSAVETYHYNGKSCKGFFPVDLSGITACHPELFGIRSNLLPDYKTTEVLSGGENSSKTVYSYTFDNDGYVISTTMEWIEETEHGTYTWYVHYLYTWE